MSDHRHTGAGRRRTLIVVIVAVLALGGVLVGVLLSRSSTTAGPPRTSVAPPTSALTSPPASSPTSAPTSPPGPEGIPLESGTPLAPPSGSVTGQTIDGVRCNATEQIAYHVHSHLSIYVDGVLRPVPAGIGIVVPVAQQTRSGAFYGASRCYYWLHVHAQDGVIHIESPVQQTYTLGNFFDLWGQPLSSGQVGPAKGTMTVYVDGIVYQGDPRSIPLGSHQNIQIDVGTQVPPMSVDWTNTSL